MRNRWRRFSARKPGHNTIFTVRVADGAEEKAMMKDWQVDPLTGALLHVDLLRIAMDVRMRVRVPVHTFGEPQGVKMQGGIFEMVTREVELECLPGDIPEEFKVDVSGLMIGKQLRAADIPLDAEKMKLITDPLRVIAHVVTLKKEEEPAAEAAVAAETAAGRARSHQEGQEGRRRRRRRRSRSEGRENREEEVSSRGGCSC